MSGGEGRNISLKGKENGQKLASSQNYLSFLLLEHSSYKGHMCQLPMLSSFKDYHFTFFQHSPLDCFSYRHHKMNLPLSKVPLDSANNSVICKQACHHCPPNSIHFQFCTHSPLWLKFFSYTHSLKQSTAIATSHNLVLPRLLENFHLALHHSCIPIKYPNSCEFYTSIIITLIFTLFALYRGIIIAFYHLSGTSFFRCKVTLSHIQSITASLYLKISAVILSTSAALLHLICLLFFLLPLYQLLVLLQFQPIHRT